MGRKLTPVRAHRRRTQSNKGQKREKPLIEQAAEKDFERMSKMWDRLIYPKQ